MPTIVVLVKNVPDSWSEHSLNPDYTLDRESVTEVIDEINEYAVEKALALRDSNEGFRVVALSAGPERAEEALRKALAMGADTYKLKFGHRGSNQPVKNLATPSVPLGHSTTPSTLLMTSS